MKLYIVKGEHAWVPGQPQFASFDLAKANEFAAGLVTTMQHDVATARDEDAGALEPVAPDAWEQGLVTVQTWRTMELDGVDYATARQTVEDDGTEQAARDTEFDVWIEELDVEMPASRKVWFGAFDGENGTVLNMAFSQRAIEDWLLEQVDKTREEFEEWSGELAPGALVGFDDFLRAEGDFLDSWSWESFDVPVPFDPRLNQAIALLRDIGRDDDGDGMLDSDGMDAIAAFLAGVDGGESAAGTIERHDAAIAALGFDGALEQALGLPVEIVAVDAGGCGQCEGSGTIEGGLGGDGEDEACPVCDGTGDLPAPEVKESDPAALIGAGLDLIDDVQWTIVEDANTVRFLSLDFETDEPRVFRARIERETV